MSLKALAQAVEDFRSRPSGNAILIALAILLPIMLLTGAALDYGMAWQARRKLDVAAQSAAAAAVAQSRALRAIFPDVPLEDMMEKGRGRADMVFNAQKPNVQNVRTNFRLERTSERSTYLASVEYEALMPSVFMRLVGLRELSLRGRATALWVARDALLDDDFSDYEAEVRAAGTKAFAPLNGWVSGLRLRPGGSPVMPLSAADRYPGAPPPPGVAVALELDTGIDSGFIAKKFSADPGLHQVRYWYRDQARNETLAPAWLCGAREEDVMWMTSRDRSLAGNTNRMSVHLVLDDGGRPPSNDLGFHAGNRIDACYSSGGRWIERVIKVDIATRGDYWIAFRPEGKLDSIGPLIANILVCREPCARDNGDPRPAPSSNFPWRTDEVLFEDRFTSVGENPIANSPPNGASGWDYVPPGWTVWPQNQVGYVAGKNGASGYAELDVRAPSGSYENRAMARSFMLVPGFYQLRYQYSTGASQVTAAACNYFSVEGALQRVPRQRGADSRRMSVHIDSDFASLHPELSGRSAEERASWYTPDRMPERDARLERLVRLPSLANAVDFCIDAPAGVPISREVMFKVERPGLYWITFVGGGAADGDGGRVSAVQLIAKGAVPGGAALPRLVRGFDRNDPINPPMGSWVAVPSSAGSKAPYKVQL